MLRKPSRKNPRDYDAYKEFRIQVLKRDGFRCQMPDCKSTIRLQVHHIIRHADSVHGRLNTGNAITLCTHHHKIVTSSEGHYKKLFFQIAQQNQIEYDKRRNKNE